MSSSPSPLNDPRVYFSAERTLLSWLRLGIGIMAFGFVIARFGLFLEMVQPQKHLQNSSEYSLYTGALLVFVGAASIFLGMLRYRSFCRTLQPGEIPSSSTPLAPTLLCLAITILGILLTLHLLM